MSGASCPERGQQEARLSLVPPPQSRSSGPGWKRPRPPPSLTQPLHPGNLWPFLPASLSKYPRHLTGLWGPTRSGSFAEGLGWGAEPWGPAPWGPPVGPSPHAGPSLTPWHRSPQQDGARGAIPDHVPAQDSGHRPIWAGAQQARPGFYFPFYFKDICETRGRDGAKV